MYKGVKVQLFPFQAPQDRPLLVINGVDPYKWRYECVTEAITLVSGVITPLITGRGPLCKCQTCVFLGINTSGEKNDFD